MLKFRCKECDQKIGVPEEWALHNVRCPRCRNAVLVPRLIDAVARPGPVAPQSPTPAGPMAPKAPLMPMPPLMGKTVGVPHPAVKRKAPAKPTAATVIPAMGNAPVQRKPAEPPSHPKRKKSPVAEPVAPVAPVVPPEPVTPSEPIEPMEPASAPEPVIVSARRAVEGGIVIEVPVEKDFSSLFSDGGAGGVASSNVSPFTAEAGGDDETNPVDAPGPGAPLSEMMDAMGGPEESGVTSSATVSDIVKGLTRERAALPPPDAAIEQGPREVVEDRFPRRVEKPVGFAWAWGIGGVAMCLGVAALAFCVTPRVARFALPVGTCGLVLAVIGAVVPARRRGTEVALALGSSAISVTGVALAILVATGVVPSSVTAHFVSRRAGAMPSARVGDVEVRVASVAVVHPVVYSEGKKAPAAEPQPRLRVGIEVRNLSGSGSVAYKSWGAARADLEPVILLDDEGNQLKLKDPAPGVPPGRPRDFPAVIPGHSRGVTDVLLFEVPPAAVRDLYLQLPGSNVQAPGGFNIQIPASMLRKQ
jgi:DNA-directed RNA polymerase subunit RPC12/RpoP